MISSHQDVTFVRTSTKSADVVAHVSTRRALLQTIGLTSLGLLAFACAPQIPTAPTNAQPAAPASATHATGKLRLPIYVPAARDTPDLPGTPEGVGPLVAGDVLEVEVSGVGVLGLRVEG